MARRPKPKRPSQQTFQATIDALSHDGRGIARRDGKTVFIAGALPGERITARLLAQHRRFDEAIAEQVAQAAAERCEPHCPHVRQCGGCSLQHLQVAAQRTFKQQALAEQLAHFGAAEPETWAAPLVAAAWGYRRKARLGVRITRQGELIIGFRERANRHLTPIRQCPVLEPRLAALLAPLYALLEQLECKRTIGHLELAAGDEAQAVVLRHLKPLSARDRALWVEFARQQAVALYAQPAGPDALVPLWPEQGAARLYYALPEFGLRLGFQPTDFTQVNAELNRQMVSQAVAWLDPQPGERILDLFCGFGNFTLPLARRAAQVVGVEGVAAMSARGRENAVANGLANVEFVTADLTAPLAQQPWAQQRFDKVLLDPPRSGALDVIRQLPALAPARVLYVSCNPATLARDAGELMRQGYTLKQAGIMDMFTHTEHVESMALFEQATQNNKIKRNNRQGVTTLNG